MSPAAPPRPPPFGGSAVGALVAALAVAAHGIGGGGLPESAALTLLFVTCSGVGAVTAQLPARVHGPLALVGALGVGQVAGHFALTLTSHVHSVVPAVPMLAAHAAATVICALLIANAERLYGPLVHVWRVVLRGEPQPVSAAPTAHVPARPANPVDALLRASISRRGPPVPV
ncbi:hypothetical protein Rwratislav_02292 [Rhodococcus wratislaviensis IFP 2016]|nr:hypothetical protein Rwratislav_02292 [Rhodococcus wratislaviensis IFP 2016]